MKRDEQVSRNKEQSRQKLIDAVGTIILRDGFNAIGINSVAKEADLDKVLIYRYFDGLDGLLREFAKRKDFYINISDLILDEIENARAEDLKELIIKILVSQLRGLRENQALQELMVWEILERNELTIAIAKDREEKGYELSKRLKEKMNLTGNESDAAIALLVSGIYYLVLRARTVDVFNGVDLSSEEGWLQIEKAIRQIVISYFDSNI
jgi:AcrR family transcriptional regulator